MSTTYGDAINRVRYLLRSVTGSHERSTHLTAAATNVATTLTVSDGAAVADGLVEIDDELIWVSSVSSVTLTVPPYGRGYASSAAASHAIGAQVLVDPAYPRKAIADAIVDTQRALFPSLFAVDTTDITWAGAQGSYELPADCERVLSVSYQSDGPSGYWQPMRRYTFDINASTTAFSTGRALHFREGAPSGNTVRVVYAKAFTEFATIADTLVAAGHEVSHFDLLVYGAAAKLVQFAEVSHLQTNAVENSARAQFAPSGSASALTRQLLAIYDRRLAEEQRKLRDRNPVTITFKTR